MVNIYVQKKLNESQQYLQFMAGNFANSSKTAFISNKEKNWYDFNQEILELSADHNVESFCSPLFWKRKEW